MRDVGRDPWLAKLALFALCLQIFVTLGHHHDHAPDHSLDHSPGHSIVGNYHAALTDHDCAEPHSNLCGQPASDYHPDDEEDHCAPCLSLAAAYSTNLPAPAALAIAADFTAIDFEVVLRDVGACRYAFHFHARGPPALTA